ncbi:hypothetical protein [Ekhidna sp.]
MDWFIPITILPGVGMLVLSTTNQMLALSGEIERLLSARKDDYQLQIVEMKIIQLERLTQASTLLYVAAALYVLSGIAAVLLSATDFDKWILIVDVIVTFIALALLITYSYKAINIRKTQHQSNLKKVNKA